jgi:hypothetical protein
MPAAHAHRTVQIRARIAGALELVIAALAVARFLHGRAVAGVATEAAGVATSGGGTFTIAWSAVTIVTPLLIGFWLLTRGPTWLIDKLMVVSLIAALWMFATGFSAALGSPVALASSVASVVMAFACWKLTRDDLALLGAAAVFGAATAVALVEAFAGEQDLGVGGWVDSDGDPLTVVVEPAPARARLLARDDMGGWLELPGIDAATGLATAELPAGRWYLALQAPAALSAGTTLRVLRDAPAEAVDASAPLAA